ncbi:hypothetical protein N0V82_005566 [Gnomoniopsis sp. IMI 355080]|nr:hypothetical protein N0V82_005566 [Gnomoniopsis sp. IMI 355080]
MGYSDSRESAETIGGFQDFVEQKQRRKSCVFRTLTFILGATLAVYALYNTLLPSTLLQRFGCDQHATENADEVANELKFEHAIENKAVSSGSGIVRRDSISHALSSIRELDMTRTNDTREGQPVVAVNPTNPDNLVYVSTRFYPLDSLSPVGGCFLAYTFDRGHTWINVTADYPLGDAPYCGEPQVFPDANGTFYLLNNQVWSDLEENEASHPQLSKSTDGGMTWSVPVLTPLYMQGATKLRVDLSTGKVYANGASSWEYPAAVSVSSDGGETWAPFNTIPGPIDVCLDYEIPGLAPVCGFPGRSIAVHNGILASAAEGANGYPEMYVSRDDGVTWTTLPLTDSDGNLVANGTGAMMPVSGVQLPSDPTPWVSADPTKNGSFALMVPRNYSLEIYVTDDAGEHFRGPTVIQTPYAQRPAMDFGSTGLLGVMWRTNASNILDAYSVMSFDRGQTFSPPLKVTHMSHPVGETGQPGDRASFIATTDEYAYVAWSDGRDDMLDAIFAEVPLALYNSKQLNLQLWAEAPEGMDLPQQNNKNIVIIGGGIIGVTTAYYLTRHPKFNPSLHTITLLEATSIAAGASGKSGGLLALWAYPECLVPLSYRLHRELAEQYGGDQKWGYRRVKCGTIGAVVKKTTGPAASKAVKENAQAKIPAAEPGMSALQTTETNTPLHSCGTSPSQTSQANATATAAAAASNNTGAHNHTNGTASQFTQAAFALIPGSTPTPEGAVVQSARERHETTEASVQDAKHIVSTDTKREKDDEKDWEKLPKQDTAATSLLGGSTIPADLDWIEPQFVQYYEEMGRRGFTDTAQVHPLHFTTAMAELARSAGVDIRTGAKVTNFTTSNTSPDLKVVEYEVRTNNEELNLIDEVTDIIVTAGPWTGKLLPRSKIEGLRAHSVVYEANVSPYAVFTDIQLPGDYVPEHRARAGQKRKHRGNVDPEVYARPFGEVYACGEPDKDIALPETADQVQTDQGQCDDLTAYLGTISPVLAAASIKAKQACYIPQHIRFGKERGPLIGPTATPGIWIAAGHTCWGIQNGPATGFLMAEYIFDGEAKAADIDTLHPVKFKV